MTGLDLAYPFDGRWLVRNSPADRVPSHGTNAFATTYAIDFVGVRADGKSAPISAGSLVRPEPAALFPGFGRPILAPVCGTVVAVHGIEPDHRAYRGLLSVGYALTQNRRASQGWVALAGNHVLIETSGAVVALCHLRQGSIEVEAGQPVRVGDRLGACGNSGNSTEPHLHVQAVTERDIARADGVPITFGGVLPTTGQVVEVER